MTREQLDAIRARVEAAPKVGDTFIDENGDETRIVETREDKDFRALLEEVTRLTAEAESKVAQNVALIGQNGRLQQEVERLTADPLPAAAWVREVERAAFQRGVAAMREAAAHKVASYTIKVMDPFGNVGTVVEDPMHILVAEIRAIPDPEDRS